MDPKPHFRESFGVFSPTGAVVMVFPDEDRAEKARQELIRAGFSESDVIHYCRDEVMKELEKSEEHSIDPLQIGQEVAKVDAYLDFAREGSGFLVVRAPKAEQTQSALDIAHHFGLKFAEKYNRLTLVQVA
jgi:tRNA A58 N-methylase Trm61